MERVTSRTNITKPLGQNVERGIGVTIVDHATCRTNPFTYVQWKRVEHMLADMAGLRRWVPLIDLDQGASVPPGFVFQLADELAPPHIGDRLSKLVVFDHVLDGQTLDTHDLVFVDDTCGEFVDVKRDYIIYYIERAI